MIVLTEKPSVARDLAAGLGGFSYTPYGDKDGYYSNGSDCIVSAAGHLLTLFEPQDYDPKFKTWKIEDLPIIPDNYFYKPIDSTFKVLKKIKFCFEKFDNKDFVLATDAEREGEHIGALILNYVGFKNYNSAKRFWVSEALTPEVVQEGFKNLKPLSSFESYKEAGIARARSDWLLGMNVSRLLAVSTGTNAFFGRVQTAILNAIYLRDKNISQFKPQNYYQLEVTSLTPSIKFLLNKNDTDKFQSKDELSNLKNQIKDKTLKITNISTEDKIENPPSLFNLTGLQKYCSVKLHLTPEETLDIAQELYEKYKCLSYPRTPSIVLGDNNVELYKRKFDLLKSIYPQLAQGCANDKIDVSNKHLFNSDKLQDHHALIPLTALPDNVSDKHKAVYEAVVQRFFQVIKEPFKYGITTIKANALGELFIAKGKTIYSRGWKTEETDEDELSIIPKTIINVDDELIVSNSAILEKETKPKKHYTNASILALMENPKGEDENLGKLVGIGTPATRAAIISTLIRREYLMQKGQQLLITNKGIFIIETIRKIPSLNSLIAIDTTTEWERELDSKPSKFLDSMTEFVRNEIPQIEIKEKWERENLGGCPICKNGKILSGVKNYYCSNYKEGCKFVIWKDNFCHAKITENDVMLLLAGKETKQKTMISKKTGKQFQAKLKAEIVNKEVQIKPVF